MLGGKLCGDEPVEGPGTDIQGEVDGAEVEAADATVAGWTGGDGPGGAVGAVVGGAGFWVDFRCSRICPRMDSTFEYLPSRRFRRLTASDPSSRSDILGKETRM